MVGIVMLVGRGSSCHQGHRQRAIGIVDVIMSTGAWWGGILVALKPALFNGVFLTGGYPTATSCLDRLNGAGAMYWTVQPARPGPGELIVEVFECGVPPMTDW